MQLLTFSPQTCHKMGVSIVTHNAGSIWNYNLLIKMSFPPALFSIYFLFLKKFGFATLVYLFSVPKEVWKEFLKIKKALLNLKLHVASPHFHLYVINSVSFGNFFTSSYSSIIKFVCYDCFIPWEKEKCVARIVRKLFIKFNDRPWIFNLFVFGKILLWGLFITHSI